MKVTGKLEFEVRPGQESHVRKWIERMLRQFLEEGGRLHSFAGSASDNGYRLDDSVGGFFSPATAEIFLFFADEDNLGYMAEELAHYLQYREQGLIGKTEVEIGTQRIDENERKIKEVLLANGFRIRR